MGFSSFLESISRMMPLENTLSTFHVVTRRRLSRMRPSSALCTYFISAVVIIVIVYQITTTLVLYPLAYLHFKLTARVSSIDVTRSIWDPVIASTFAIGAMPLNRTDEIAKRRTYVNYASLPMRRPEVDLLLSYLRPTDVYLEFGASGTTLSFPHLVRQAYSVEHDMRVCQGISEEMRAHAELSFKLRAFCAPVPAGRDNWAVTSPFEEGSYRAFHNYVDFPRANLSGVLFDRVLINGRARVACALRVLPQLHPTSLVFFHDFFLRPAHYAAVLAYYDEVARVVAHAGVTGYTDAPMGLVVLRPKRDYVVIDAPDVSIARVNAIYDAYKEMPPSSETTGFDVATRHGLDRTDQGGFPYYEMSRALARQTTRTRLLLDAVALPFVFVIYFILDLLLRRVFRDAISSSSNSTSSSAASQPPASARHSSRAVSRDSSSVGASKRAVSTTVHASTGPSSQPLSSVSGSKAE